MTTSPGRTVFLGPDPLPALGSHLPVICTDGCGLSRTSEPGWEDFPKPGAASTAALLRGAAVQARLHSGVEDMVVWKSSAEVEQIAEKLGVTVANSPALISRRIENKTYFSRAAESAGLPIPPTRVGVAGPELQLAVRELRGPFVFQLARGYSGEQTYLAESGKELEELIQRFNGRSCRVAEMVPGTPVTLTGVVSPERLVIGPACLQLTGLPTLTPHPLGSCGNDYGRPVPEPEGVHEVGLRMAEWLRRQGHLGIFGLDLVVGANGMVVCIEVNPRLVASVPLFSLSARDLDSPSILDLHLASFGIGEQAAQQLDCHWSQLILYQLRDRLPDPELQSSRGSLTATGEFTQIGDLELMGPPAHELGLLVQAQSRSGKELARVFLEGACCSPDGLLLPQLQHLVGQLRALLEVAPSAGDVS
ncbi:MAG TPA: ATP-grasp domain-containing protein [Candidatus Micrarchaeaceae archaeon]|nr:ATP-grasp domain-containing protein [Candidatus Micrarchaeaceae archaeon]